MEGAPAGEVLVGGLAAALDLCFGIVAGRKVRCLASLHLVVAGTEVSYVEGGMDSGRA